MKFDIRSWARKEARKFCEIYGRGYEHVWSDMEQLIYQEILWRYRNRGKLRVKLARQPAYSQMPTWLK